MRHITMTPCFRVVSTFDLPPLQGASLWGRFPGLKPWAESSCPFGALRLALPLIPSVQKFRVCGFSCKEGDSRLMYQK
jgi:hypothetical protein